jgi:2-succinyl-5-enolpyruvyl-6-hydroxy-3-cyclohexene-1-carboxylate synthase
VDLAALCAATGAGHTRVEVPDLAAALAPAPGVRVVEVRAGRRELREGHALLRAAVDAAVAEAL